MTNAQDSNQSPRQQKSPEKLPNIPLAAKQIRCQNKENQTGTPLDPYFKAFMEIVGPKKGLTLPPKTRPS